MTFVFRILHLVYRLICFPVCEYFIKLEKCLTFTWVRLQEAKHAGKVCFKNCQLRDSANQYPTADTTYKIHCPIARHTISNSLSDTIKVKSPGSGWRARNRARGVTPRWSPYFFFQNKHLLLRRDMEKAPSVRGTLGLSSSTSVSGSRYASAHVLTDVCTSRCSRSWCAF